MPFPLKGSRTAAPLYEKTAQSLLCAVFFALERGLTSGGTAEIISGTGRKRARAFKAAAGIKVAKMLPNAVKLLPKSAK